MNWFEVIELEAEIVFKGLRHWMKEALLQNEKSRKRCFGKRHF